MFLHATHHGFFCLLFEGFYSPLLAKHHVTHLHTRKILVQRRASCPDKYAFMHILEGGGVGVEEREGETEEKGVGKGVRDWGGNWIGTERREGGREGGRAEGRKSSGWVNE